MATVRTFAALLLTLLLAAVPTEARIGAARSERPLPRPVTVGVFDLEPLTCAAPGHTDDPVLGQIFGHIARQENWQVTIVGGSLDSLEALLEKSEIDLLMAAPYSREKSARFRYCRQTVISTWARIYVAAGAQIQSLLDLTGKSIGVVRSSPYNLALRRLLGQFNINHTIVEFDRPEEILRAVADRWIDAGAVDRFFGILAAGRYPVEETQAVFSPIELRFAAPLSAPADLLEAIDYHLAALKQDKASIYHRLLDRALVQPEPSRMMAYLGWGLAAAAAATLLSGGIAVLLRRQVKARTRELTQKKADLQRELDQRKAAESAARQSEARYRSAFNNTGAGMILFDAALRIHAANTEARTLSGIHPSGNPAQFRLTDFILPEDLERLRAAADRDAILGLPLNRDLELRIRDHCGHLRNILGRINALPETGQFIASVIDITERLSGEAERHRLATAIEQSTDSIFITDQERRIIYANPAFETMTGHERAQVIGRTPDFLWGSRYDAAAIGAIITHTAQGNTWRGRLTNRRKDGSAFETQTAISAIRAPTGAITHYVNVKRDISQECRLEDQLREAQKMQAVGTLAGGIAHDFNNILAAIMGFSELGRLDCPPGSPVEKRLGQILNACDRAKDLINQILTFSRKDDAARKPVVLGPVITEALGLLRATLPASIAFHADGIDGSAVAMANATQIHQIVMNLCTNAAFAMKDQASGRLTVSLVRRTISAEKAGALAIAAGSYLVLTVSDTGKGMDSETRQRLFEPFFTTKPTGEGTGLGLSVVHGIVKSHEGAITVDSAAGTGSTFRLYFPEVTGGQGAVGVSAQPLPRGEGVILFIDDERMLRETAAAFIPRLGYTLAAFDCPAAALAAYRADPGRFDLVMTDYHMPGMTGLALAEKIHAQDAGIPIVLCTGYISGLRAETLAATGIRHILAKPFHQMELATTLKRWIAGRPQATRMMNAVNR